MSYPYYGNLSGNPNFRCQVRNCTDCGEPDTRGSFTGPNFKCSNCRNSGYGGHSNNSRKVTQWCPQCSSYFEARGSYQTCRNCSYNSRW